MINRDIIESKLAAMKGYLSELSPLLESLEDGALPDSTKRHAIERLLQLIVDVALDINTHIITQHKFGSADDYQSTFAILAQNSVIPEDLARRIAPSVGLRNLLVHGYEKVDVVEMLASIRKNIGQYGEYIERILTYLNGRDGKSDSGT